MTKPEKVLKKILSGSKNIRFGEMILIVESFGFELDRISGSHHLFVHREVPELVNLQEVKGKAKPCQVGQFLRIVERYNLRMRSEG
jgi:predicted RNA binding protein YcfA (HicA-like mRNA interferase family)